MLLVFLLFLCMMCANLTEPSHHNKLDVVDALSSCPVPWRTEHTSWVVKPQRGTSQGKGVSQDPAWTIDKCQTLGVKCGRQGYHPGPIEGRMYKSGTWKRTIVWDVPTKDPDPRHASFPWERQLQHCIDSLLPGSPALAVDFRTNGTDVQVMEVNGTFGIPLEWTMGSVIDLPKWVFDRIMFGVLALLQGRLKYLHQDLYNLYTQIRLRKTFSNVWF